MDIPALLTTASNESSSISEAKNENSMVIPAASKRAKFFSTYQRQSFSLPDSVMYYTVQNPRSSKMYQKMIQTCKYFFVKNPIIVFSGLRNYNNEWRDGVYGIPKFIKKDMSKFSCKFWITKIFQVGSIQNNEEYYTNLVSSIIPKIYRCYATELDFLNQTISYSDLPLLISSAERIIFNYVTVTYENGSNAPFEKIVEVAFKAKQIEMLYPIITLETMKELIKIPHFLNIQSISLFFVAEAFDIETFYSYIITNSQRVWLHFANPISDAYKSRLNAVIDKILTTEVFNYKIPFIDSDEIDFEQRNKLSHYWCTR